VKPAPFAYHAPETLAKALALLTEHGDDAKLLAGGQSLIPILALRLSRFAHLIDLGGVAELRGVEKQDGGFRVGAMTTQAAIERHAELGRLVPLLARATPWIGHFQIRNRGTLGGSIAHADPAAEYPAVALTLDAELEIAGRSGMRRVPARDFFVSTWMTAVEPDEVLAAVHFPERGERSGFAIDEVARRLGDFALAGAACAVELDGRARLSRAAIGLFGVASTPRRAASAEKALLGASARDLDLEAVGQAAIADMEPNDDVHASADYRRKVGAVLVGRVLGRALEEARGV